MMIADLLLRPDNRLLGGATGDFSLFGGQPTPGVTFVREAAANGHVSIAAPATNDAMSGATAPVSAATSPLGHPVDKIPAASDDGAGNFSGAGPASSPAAATPDSSAPMSDDMVPTALLSGGLVAAGFAALGLANSIPAPQSALADTAPNPLAPSGAGLDAPTLDQLVPSIGTLTTTIAPVADVAGDLAEVTASVADAVIDPLAAGVAEAVDPVVTSVADSVAPVTDAVAGVAAPVVETAADALAPVVDAAAPVIDTIADTAGPVVAAVAPATEPIVDAVQPAGAVAQPAVDAVAAITGEALGGSDPAGGVQTLVGMVANADAFDVIAPGTASSGEPSSSVIDDLIGDAGEVAPLLGDQDGGHDDDGPDLFDGHGGLGLG